MTSPLRCAWATSALVRGASARDAVAGTVMSVRPSGATTVIYRVLVGAPELGQVRPGLRCGCGHVAPGAEVGERGREERVLPRMTSASLRRSSTQAAIWSALSVPTASTLRSAWLRIDAAC